MDEDSAPKRVTHFEKHHELPPLINPPLPEPLKPMFTAPQPLSFPLPKASSSARTCQWLEGDPSELNWCGKPVAWLGCSWCGVHEKIVFPHGRPRLRAH